MISQEEARARVARGAAHLDVVRPGWFNRIDVGTLTLHDPCGCIVGQLTGSNGWFDHESLGMDNDSVIAFGCDLSNHEYGLALHSEDDDPRCLRLFVSLQDAWIEAIADRRLATQSTVADIPSAVMVSR